jgi:hypothetical protein
MSSKQLEITKKTLTLKNGKRIETTTVKAKNPKKLITFNVMTKLLKKLQDNGEDLKKYKIVGVNKIQMFTLKMTDDDFDYDYLRNKPKDIVDKLDGFYSFQLISGVI